jgi:hypothetical protein
MKGTLRAAPQMRHAFVVVSPVCSSWVSIAGSCYASR